VKKFVFRIEEHMPGDHGTNHELVCGGFVAVGEFPRFSHTVSMIAETCSG
jgi:hypothetical protein